MVKNLPENSPKIKRPPSLAILFQVRYSGPLEKRIPMNRSPQVAKKDSWKLFDQIAQTYDALNSLVSLRADRLWRKKLAQKTFTNTSL